MKPWVTSRYVLTWLCIIPADDSCPIAEKCLHIAFTTLVVLFNFFPIVSASIYFARNVVDNLQDALYAIDHVVAFTCVTYGTLMLFIYKTEIVAMFDHMEQIYRTSKPPCQK